MIRLANLFILTAALLGISSGANAQYISAGHWKDVTGKHRSSEQFSADYDNCRQEFEARFPSKNIKPGRPGHYYENAMEWAHREQTYIMFTCMPEHKWRWITDRLIRNPLAQ